MGFLPSIGKKKDGAAEASKKASEAPGEPVDKKCTESMAVLYTKNDDDGKDLGPDYMDTDGGDDASMRSLADDGSFITDLPVAGGDLGGSGA